MCIHFHEEKYINNDLVKNNVFTRSCEDSHAEGHVCFDLKLCQSIDSVCDACPSEPAYLTGPTLQEEKIYYERVLTNLRRTIRILEDGLDEVYRGLGITTDSGCLPV